MPTFDVHSQFTEEDIRSLEEKHLWDLYYLRSNHETVLRRTEDELEKTSLALRCITGSLFALLGFSVFLSDYTHRQAINRVKASTSATSETVILCMDPNGEAASQVTYGDKGTATMPLKAFEKMREKCQVITVTPSVAQGDTTGTGSGQAANNHDEL